MAAAFTEVRKYPGLRTIRVVGTIALSGNYTTGGETLTGLVKPFTTKDPQFVSLNHRRAATLSWNPTTQKLMAWTAPNTEHAAAAYAAAFTADVIDAEFEYPKGG